MGNPPPSNQATRSSPFNSLEKVNATRRLPSFPTTAQLMEDLANEVRRIIRNLNLGTKIDQLLQEMPDNYHPTQNIGRKKYKGEVILAHSRYHQENPTTSCSVYQHFTPLNIDAILEQRRHTEGLLLCNNSPKVSIDTHAFVKAWCKGHFHPGCYYPGDYKEKNQDLQVKQRALDRWFHHLDNNIPTIPSSPWTQRDDSLGREVLSVDTTWQYQPCLSCLNANCTIPPGETCCGMCSAQGSTKTNI